MAPYAINGDAEHFRVEPVELGHDLVVQGHLIAADGLQSAG
jgi:hypothetical protein